MFYSHVDRPWKLLSIAGRRYAIDVGERAEPVVFQLEQPIVMVERIRDPHQRHRTSHEGDGVERTTTAG
jgi:hypothetical protein